MSKEKQRYFFFLILTLWVSTSIQADAGGPLLLLINFETFLIGSIWIILVEYFYLKRKYKDIPKSKILDITIQMNFFSSLIGVIVIPIMVMITVLIVGRFIAKYSVEWADVIAMLGTYVVGKFVPKLSVTSTYFYFPITYFITVYFEYHMLYRYLIRFGPCDKRKVLIESYVFNGISYMGLAIPFVIFLSRTTPNM